MATPTAKEKLATLIDAVVVTLGVQGFVITPAQRSALYTTASTWVDAQINTSVALSDTKPEYQQILVQFQNDLERSDGWRDTLTAGTGQTLLRFVASTLAYAVLAMERIVQERFPFTAKLPSSIYAATRSQGVHINRRTPASVPVLLERSGLDYLLIPKMTSFVINDVPFFNRDTIVFVADDANMVAATLHQGQVLRDTYTASGAPFAPYEIGAGDWTLSEQDIYLSVAGVAWTGTIKGLYNVKPNERVFYTNTLPNGNIELVTGSGNVGAIPSTGTQLAVTYVSTEGASALNTTTGLRVICTEIAGVLGDTTGPISGGMDPLTPQFYKINGSAMASSQDRAVIRRDYDLAAIRYPGLKILDARVLGQQEIDPTRKALMNIVHVGLLTEASSVGPPVTAPQWHSFTKYLAGLGIFQVVPVRMDPVPVTLNIKVIIGVLPDTNRVAVKKAAVQAYQTFYAPREGALGRAFYKQDLVDLLRNTLDPSINQSINYIDPVSPTPDSLILDRLDWLKLATLGEDDISVVYTDRDYSNRQVE